MTAIINSFKYFALLLIMSSILLLSACNNSKNSDASNSKTTPEVNVAITGNINTLDVQETSATITNQIALSVYNTLLDIKGNAELAKSWDVSSDFLTWTFRLHEDILFHNGQRFTAKDVEASFIRIKNVEIDSPFYGALDNLKELQIIDDYTIAFVLEKKDFSMPNILASPEYSIFPSELIESAHNFSQDPVGTGPFKFDSWEQGVKIRLVKNDEYFFNVEGNVEAINFYLISDVNVQVQNLIQGDIDVVPYLIEPELSRIKKESNLYIEVFPIATISLLAMNTRKAPFNSLEFRKAVAQAIDKDKVISLAYPSGTKTNAFWPSNTQYSVDVAEIFDLDAAQKFFENFTQEAPIEIAVPSNFIPHVRAGELYQNQLSALGLEAVVTPIPWTTWLDQVYGKGDFDMTVIGHTGKISPYQRLKGFITTGSYVGWENAQFDEYIAALDNAEDLETVNQIYRDIFTLMTEDYPFVFVVENAVNMAINKSISGLIFDNTLESYDFTQTVVNIQ